MNEQLEAGFKAMGAQVQVRPPVTSPRVREPRLSVNVSRGGIFTLIAPEHSILQVLDLRPSEKQMLLFANVDGQKSRFLVGHDEKDWFVAAVPERTPAKTVFEAKQALKPEAVLQAERGLKRNKKEKRKNAAYVRQGDWFFVPQPGFRPDPDVVLNNEPIGRMARNQLIGNPHMCQFLVRIGGTRVWQLQLPWTTRTVWEKRLANVREMNDSGRERFMAQFPDARQMNWTSWIRDPEVYVRGTVRHRDHRTIKLQGWHRVHPNTEPRARAMAHVAFVD